VDRLGVEPSASCLQGISPPRRPAPKRIYARLLISKSAYKRAIRNKCAFTRVFW